MNEMLNRLSHLVIGRAIEVHRELGPGLLESAYEECLAYEFQMASLKFERQKPIALKYKTLSLVHRVVSWRHTVGFKGSECEA
jgi:GxxExxY protein